MFYVQHRRNSIAFGDDPQTVVVAPFKVLDATIKEHILEEGNWGVSPLPLRMRYLCSSFTTLGLLDKQVVVDLRQMMGCARAPAGDLVPTTRPTTVGQIP